MPLDPDDPLVPMPDPAPWFDPAAHGGDLNLAAEQVADYFSFNSVIWPAKDADGNLVLPPPEHVLDHLVHSYALLPEDQTLGRDPVNTVVVTSRQYGCDWCPEVARYDGYFERPGANRVVHVRGVLPSRQLRGPGERRESVPDVSGRGAAKGARDLRGAVPPCRAAVHLGRGVVRRSAQASTRR